MGRLRATRRHQGFVYLNESVYVGPGHTTTIFSSCKQMGMLGAVSRAGVVAAPARRGGRGARERILKAAATLFYRDGIYATGVDRLAQEASVSKRTFYQHFPSKSDLVEEYLRSLDKGGGSHREQALDNAHESARGRLLAIFDSTSAAIFDATNLAGRVRGCPFHNAAVESAGAMPGLDHIVLTHKLQFIDRLIHVATTAGAIDPYRLGHQLAVLFEGSSALSTSLNDRAPLVHARSAAAALIDAAIAD
jgi:AcrR family transcriptional regulator